MPVVSPFLSLTAILKESFSGLVYYRRRPVTGWFRIISRPGCPKTPNSIMNTMHNLMPLVSMSARPGRFVPNVPYWISAHTRGKTRKTSRSRIEQDLSRTVPLNCLLSGLVFSQPVFSRRLFWAGPWLYLPFFRGSLLQCPLYQGRLFRPPTAGQENHPNVPFNLYPGIKSGRKFLDLPEQPAGLFSLEKLWLKFYLIIVNIDRMDLRFTHALPVQPDFEDYGIPCTRRIASEDKIAQTVGDESVFINLHPLVNMGMMPKNHMRTGINTKPAKAALVIPGYFYPFTTPVKRDHHQIRQAGGLLHIFPDMFPNPAGCSRPVGPGIKLQREGTIISQHRDAQPFPLHERRPPGLLQVSPGSGVRNPVLLQNGNGILQCFRAEVHYMVIGQADKIKTAGD